MNREFLHFDRFRFDIINNELWSDNELVELPPRLIAIFRLLVQHPMALITKEEILLKVWRHPRQKGDLLLRRHVKRLRDILREYSSDSLLIETVAGRGYRFVAQVSRVIAKTQEEHTAANESAQTSYPVEHATEEDIYWIAQTAGKIFGEMTAIPLATKLAWFHKNPNGFWIVRNLQRVPIGCLEILPLREEALRRFREGQIEEKDLSPDDMYGPQEAPEANILYLENCMAIVRGDFLSSLAVTTLLINFESIITGLGVASHNAMIYAMPVEKFYTEDGEKPSPSKAILEALEFEPDTEKTGQGPLLYKLRLDRALGVTRVYQRLSKVLGSTTAIMGR